MVLAARSIVSGLLVPVISAAAQSDVATGSSLVRELEAMIAPVPPERIERAAALMSHEDAAVREAAARAVSRLDVAASRHFAVLQKIARRTERYQPLPEGAIGWGSLRLGPDWLHVEPPTEEALAAAIAADPSSEDCVGMLAAVSKRVGYSARLRERIVGLAAHEDRSVRRAVAGAMAELCEWEDVEAAIAALLKDEDAEVRAAAVSAFSRFDAPDLDAVRALLLDPESRVRASACRALGSRGKPTPSIVRELVALVRDRSPEVSGAAASALAELDVFSPGALEAVRGGLHRSELPAHAVPMLEYCQTAGRRASDLLPAIVDQLRSDDLRVRVAAMFALYLCTPDEAQGRLMLRLCTALDDASLRPYAVQLLEDLCSGAPRHALPGALGMRSR